MKKKIKKSPHTRPGIFAVKPRATFWRPTIFFTNPSFPFPINFYPRKPSFGCPNKISTPRLPLFLKFQFPMDLGAHAKRTDAFSGLLVPRIFFKKHFFQKKIPKGFVFTQKSVFDCIGTQWKAQWGQKWPQPGPRWPAKLSFWPIWANLKGFGAKPIQPFLHQKSLMRLFLNSLMKNKHNAHIKTHRRAQWVRNGPRRAQTGPQNPSIWPKTAFFWPGPKFF